MSKDDICKAETGRLAKPKDSEPTFDALAHGQQVIDNREARNMDYSEPTVNTDSYSPSKDDIQGNFGDGNKEEQDVSEEYPMIEGQPKPKPKQSEASAPTPVIEE